MQTDNSSMVVSYALLPFTVNPTFIVNHVNGPCSRHFISGSQQRSVFLHFWLLSRSIIQSKMKRVETSDKDGNECCQSYSYERHKASNVAIPLTRFHCCQPTTLDLSSLSYQSRFCLVYVFWIGLDLYYLRISFEAFIWLTPSDAHRFLLLFRACSCVTYAFKLSYSMYSTIQGRLRLVGGSGFRLVQVLQSLVLDQRALVWIVTSQHQFETEKRTRQ